MPRIATANCLTPLSPEPFVRCPWPHLSKLSPHGPLEDTGPCRGQRFTREEYEVSQPSSRTSSRTPCSQCGPSSRLVVDMTRNNLSLLLFPECLVWAMPSLRQLHLMSDSQSLKGGLGILSSIVERGKECLRLHRNVCLWPREVLNH